MLKYTRTIVDLKTGTQTVVPLSQDEIAEYEAKASVVQVPKVISPRQARLSLLQQGLLSEVETMIASQDEATRITWEYALEFRRDDPLLNQLAVNLGLTEAQIDEFFIAAASL